MGARGSWVGLDPEGPSDGKCGLTMRPAVDRTNHCMFQMLHSGPLPRRPRYLGRCSSTPRSEQHKLRERCRPPAMLMQQTASASRSRTRTLVAEAHRLSSNETTRLASQCSWCGRWRGGGYQNRKPGGGGGYRFRASPPQHSRAAWSTFLPSPPAVQDFILIMWTTHHVHEARAPNHTAVGDVVSCWRAIPGRFSQVSQRLTSVRT
ncbi:hypothetical protein N658DRAFT_187557 [Parathielavia hyrcaniae]|uniref:Uncharacterized protein n=1 Tax=Parathielavia hyrcaniae TaxID=113614 RepID=A0AAN6T4Q6_9PEZI|nr:hypothetical protein N658DRAFT_187557 [Parathielavia hyrcaniae]